MPTNLELIEQQFATLYEHDADGNIRAVNYPESPLPPRLAIGLTTEGLRWRFRHDVPTTIRATIDRLLQSESPPVDLQRLPANLAAIRAALAEDAPLEDQWFGPAWYAPADLSLPTSSVATPITDVGELGPDHQDFAIDVESQQPFVAVREDGAIAAVCFCARRSTVAAEAGVQTVEALRGRGHATAVVATWIAAVRQLGLQPLYSTSWENYASQGVARRLGLRLYGANLSLR